MYLDFEKRIDVERLKKERKEKARKSMDKYDLDALVCFRNENCRYLTIGPHYTQFFRYTVFPRNGEPILFNAGMNQPAYNLANPDLEVKPSKPVPEGLVFNEEALSRQVDKQVEQIKNELEEQGVSDGRIGVDTDTEVVQGLRDEGLRISSEGTKAMYDARLTKTKDEIELLRLGCSVVEACFEEAKKAIKPGIRENEIWARIAKKLFELGAEGIEGGLVCSGPHTWPTMGTWTDRIVRNGDLLFIDIFNMSIMGYRTCYYRTFSCGQPTQQQKDTYEKVRDWLYDSIDVIEPGATTQDIAEKWPKAEELGFSSEDAGTLALWGHGLGLTLWEPPTVSRIWSDFPEEIKPNMVFALETIAPTGEETPEYPNGQGCRLEEVVRVTENGHEILSKWPADEITVC